MKYKYVDKPIHYDGSQLKSLFAYLNFGLQGDSIVAFIGGCNIPFENMVDGEDFLQKSEIRGREMLHFIIEEFGHDLRLAVTTQRLFSSMCLEQINQAIPDQKLKRSGDDLFLDDRKLSISIATVSPVSSLIHFAMNLTQEGTPVKTVSLKDLGLDAKKMADGIATAFIEEVKTIKQACCKVHWVK